MEQEKQTNRVSRIEEFLLDPEKTIFELLEEFENSVEEIRNALSQVDVANLETLKGEDGKTPERGVDYFTDEDLDNIEAFILDRIPVVGEDVPSPKQVNEYIDKQVAKIPRVKGDKGNPGTPGKPGKNGSPDSALDIIKKLRSLDKNQGLQLNDIRGLSKKIALLNEVSDEFTKLKEDLSNIKILTSGASSDGTGAVASVNGKVGVVVLTQDDIGSGTTYVRTENNFTDALLSKLTGLQTSYSFLNLTDTPSAYTGQAGKFVKVNATNDGLEFDSIPGGGDMLASVYDPANVADDAFDMDNMVEGTNNKLVSAAEKSGWSAKQDALGFTPEDVDNKKTTMTGNTTSDTFYLTAKAIYDWATGLFQTLANKVTSFQVTPDDTHYPSEKLVKDSLDAKMTNPMTTQGDIIYGGASGLPTRLPKGTAGQVLKMNNAETAPEWGTGSSSAPYMFCTHASSPITQADEEFNAIDNAAQEVRLTTITNNNLLKRYIYTSIWASAGGQHGIVIIGGYIYFLLRDSTPDPDQFKLFRMSLTDTAYTSVTEITFSGGTTLIDSNNTTIMSSDGTNLYFTYNAGNSSNRYILAKFSLSGTTATYVSSITLSDSPTSFNYSVDSSGNIYTVASNVVKKYNSSGTLQITSEKSIGDANSLLNLKGTMYWYSGYKGCYYKLMG